MFRIKDTWNRGVPDLLWLFGVPEVFRLVGVIRDLVFRLDGVRRCSGEQPGPPSVPGVFKRSPYKKVRGQHMSVCTLYDISISISISN